jgi:hypothetical protein
MKSIFLDIETLALNKRDNNAIITNIALVEVICDTAQVGATLSLYPCVTSQLYTGRVADPDTLAFHAKHNSFPNVEYAETIDFVIDSIHEFFRCADPRYVWIQGPDFDRPILENFLIQYHSTLPWKYYLTRDARTVWNLAFPGQRQAPRPHNAIEDALATVDDTICALTALNCLHAL